MLGVLASLLLYLVVGAVVIIGYAFWFVFLVFIGTIGGILSLFDKK